MTQRDSTPGFTSYTVDVRGWPVRLVDSAPGADAARTFVLVHGLGVSSRYFHPLAHELRRHGRVIAVDLPGFGKTPTPDRTLRIAGFASVLRDALDAVGADDVVLVGHSMGCQVVVEALLQDPAVARVGVLAAPVVNTHDRRTSATVLRRFTQAAIREPWPSRWASAVAFAHCNPNWLRQHFGAMMDYRIEQRVPDVLPPVLVMGGRDDPLSPPDFVHALAAATAEPSAVRIVEGAGHQMIFTHAREVSDVIAAFADQPREAR